MLSHEDKELRKHYFRGFLNWFWLRPENALLCAIRAQNYNSTLKYFKDGKKSIDVSCGDGTFSFITFGGSLSSKCDMFRSIKNDKTFRDEKYDAFNHFSKNEYLIEIKEKPEKSYDFGLDWKNNLLKKADKLNFYNNLVHHDNNNTLPFSDGEMNYVYSNSAYWVDNFEEHLKDLTRITKSGGHLILEMKVEDIKKQTSKYYLPSMGERFHEIINAGRLSTWKGLRSKDEILRILTNIKGVKLKKVTPIYGGLPIKIWNLGFRPIFNPLSKMANNLSEKMRAEVKKEWIEIFYTLFEHILITYEASDDEAVEFLIIIEKD